jgi:hypothetical protein
MWKDCAQGKKMKCGSMLDAGNKELVSNSHEWRRLEETFERGQDPL